MGTPIVTLTADWGTTGFFAGMVKGALYSFIEDLRIVDIDLCIEPHNIMAASFVVRHACTGFPPGTVHIIDVAANRSPERPFVALRAAGQYYICCDNGLPQAALGDTVEEAVEIQVNPNGVYNFAAYNPFVPVAAELLSGTPLSELGPTRANLTSLMQPTYMPHNDGYRVFAHYIDAYGNIYLGMTFEEFERLRGQHKKFTLQVRDKRIHELSVGYIPPRTDSDPTHRLRLTVSATGLLELAMSESSFIQLIGGPKLGEYVQLTFHD